MDFDKESKHILLLTCTFLIKGNFSNLVNKYGCSEEFTELLNKWKKYISDNIEIIKIHASDEVFLGNENVVLCNITAFVISEGLDVLNMLVNDFITDNMSLLIILIGAVPKQDLLAIGNIVAGSAVVISPERALRIRKLSTIVGKLLLLDGKHSPQVAKYVHAIQNVWIEFLEDSACIVDEHHRVSAMYNDLRNNRLLDYNDEILSMEVFIMQDLGERFIDKYYDLVNFYVKKIYRIIR